MRYAPLHFIVTPMPLQIDTRAFAFSPRLKELEEVVSEPRNWKGIIIALLVITVICSGISGAILFLSHRKFFSPAHLSLRHFFLSSVREGTQKERNEEKEAKASCHFAVSEELHRCLSHCYE